jgi:hypothetical protein
MRQAESDAYTSSKCLPISVGSGKKTYGVVSLTNSRDLRIDGDATRITRLLASRRRSSFYRDMTTEEFFAALPAALSGGSIWAMPTEDVEADADLVAR